MRLCFVSNWFLHYKQKLILICWWIETGKMVKRWRGAPLFPEHSLFKFYIQMRCGFELFEMEDLEKFTLENQKTGKNGNPYYWSTQLVCYENPQYQDWSNQCFTKNSVCLITFLSNSWFQMTFITKFTICRISKKSFFVANLTCLNHSGLTLRGFWSKPLGD